MLKNVQIWRAAHPNVLIVLYLLFGILLGKKFPFPYLINHDYYHSYITIAALGIGICFILYVANYLQVVVLIIWGYLLASFQNNTSAWMPDVIYNWVAPIKNYVLQKLDGLLIDKTANGFAKAMLLGTKNQLNENLKSAYIHLGIIHIIAISGMHLDIIYQYLLKWSTWFPYTRFWKHIQLLFLVFSITTYTIMADASPSVVRASLFFCFILIGKFYYLAQYTLNNIANGMLLILLLNSRNVFQVGLQLSYAAVIGIHLFVPLLNKWMSLEHPLLQFIWNTMTITIASQLTTLPIILFYFHQTSLWIIISNLIMVPLSTILLHSLIILICAPTSFPTTILLGKLIQWYIITMNQIAVYLFQIGPTTIQIASLSIYSIISYYIILILLYLFLSKKQF